MQRFQAPNRQPGACQGHHRRQRTLQSDPSNTRRARLAKVDPGPHKLFPSCNLQQSKKDSIAQFRDPQFYDQLRSLALLSSYVLFLIVIRSYLSVSYLSVSLNFVTLLICLGSNIRKLPQRPREAEASASKSSKARSSAPAPVSAPALAREVAR